MLLISLLKVSMLGCIFTCWAYFNSGMDFRSFLVAKASKLFIWELRPQNNTDSLSSSRKLMDLVGVIAPGNVDSRDILIGETLSVTLFRPMAQNTKKDPKKPLLPVLLWFHGGGFVEGSVFGDRKNCQNLANTSGFLVLSVEYRLAPENPFPAAVEDGIVALNWVFEHVRFFGGDNKNVVIGGESAGGNIAASTVIGGILSDVNKFGGSVIGYIAVYPCLNHGSFMNSHFKYRNSNGFLTLDQMMWYWSLYLGANQSAKSQDMRACPARAPDYILSKFPRTFIILAGHDILFDEGVEFVNRLKNLKVNARYVVFEHTIHGFFGRPLFGSAGTDSLKVASDAINSMLPFNMELVAPGNVDSDTCSS